MLLLSEYFNYTGKSRRLLDDIGILEMSCALTWTLRKQGYSKALCAPDILLVSIYSIS